MPNTTNNDVMHADLIWRVECESEGYSFVNLCQTPQNLSRLWEKNKDLNKKKAQHKVVSVDIQRFLVSMKPLKVVRTRLPLKPVLSGLAQAVMCENSGAGPLTPLQFHFQSKPSNWRPWSKLFFILSPG